MAKSELPIGRTGLISRVSFNLICVMKKNVIMLSTLAVAALALFSCAKVETEIETPEVSKGVPFEIYAGSELTKTVNTNNDISWEAGNSINLFHAEAGATSYGANDQFTITAANLAANKFTGTLSAGALDPEKNYDWYALYPYDSHIGTPNNTSSGYLSIGSADKNTAQVQAGNNSMAHLSGQYFPLFGNQKNVAAATAPSLTLKPALSVIKIRVTNKKAADLVVNSIAVVAPEDIVGQYYIKFIDDDAVFTAAKNGTLKTARLNVTSGSAIAKDAYADFYIAVKPFTAAAASKLTIVVNGYSKTVTLASAFTFEAGKVHKLGFDYNAPDYDQLVYTTTGITGSAYTDWSDINGTYSSAVYAGNSFPNDDNYIQLRATSPSGIVSTTSGGKVTKVAVTWNSKTVDERTLTIYGKNTPYSGPAELYSEGTRGTSLGTIVKGTSTELSIDGYYEYVGILANGAVYIDEINITWGAAKTKIAAPTSVAASETTGGTITVTWTDVPSGVAKYVVTCTGQDSKDVLSGVGSASFSGLMNGSYDVTIQAVPTDTEYYSNSEIVSVLGVSVTGGAALPVYTLDGTNLEGSTNSGYAVAHDITQNSIGWSVTCNANINPWRVGGDKNTSDTDRALYSKTAITNNVKTIKLQSGTATLTVNSLTVTVHNSAEDAASGSNAIATFSYDDSADIISKTITMDKTDATSWANKYYRIVYNVTHGGSSGNRYVQFIKAEFYE